MPQTSLEIHHLLSPDPERETFSTPPTTPNIQSGKTIVAPSLARRSSRPSSLHIDPKQSDWNPDIELWSTSPDLSRKTNGNPPAIVQDRTVLPKDSLSHQMPPSHKSLTSPCFVHSHLDKGAHLTDWLKNKQPFVDNGDVGVAKNLQHVGSPVQSSTFTPHTTTFGTYHHDGDDDEFVGNLTKRLAETAVGVREMSKQLGMLLSPLYPVNSDYLSSRSCPRSVKYPECLDRDEGPRQSSHQTDQRTCPLSHAQT